MATTNNIQTNTPASFSLAATTQNYLTSSQLISSYTKAKKEVDPNVVYRFGDDDLGIEELMMNLGQVKGVESLTFEHYEKDYIRELVNVVATTDEAAVETLTVQPTPNNVYDYGSPSFYENSSTKYGANIRENDQVEIGGVRCKVTSVTYDSSTTFAVETISSTGGTQDTIPTGETEVIIIGNAWGEATDQPQGRETRLIKYSNNIQIIKDAYKVSGTAMGQMSWLEFQGSNKWYLEGIRDTRKYFANMCDLTMLVGEKITASSSAFNDTSQMEGIIPSIENYGIDVSYSVGSLSLTDFADLADAYAKNRGASENMILSGVKFKREVSDLLRASEGLKSGGVMYAGLGGEDRAVNLGFESFTYSGYTFHTKTLQAFNDPKSLGAASSVYKDYAIVMPTGNTTAFDFGQTAVNTPSVALVHQEVPGEDMGYAEFPIGGTGGVFNTENDSMKINMRKRQSIELFGLNRFAIFTA